MVNHNRYPFQSKARGSTVNLLKSGAKRLRVKNPRKTFDILTLSKRRRDSQGNVVEVPQG